MESKQTILVIFGITGDLARRKLLPALSNVIDRKMIENVKIIGVTRQKVTKSSVLGAESKSLNDIFSLLTMDIARQEDYEDLKLKIAKIKGSGDAQVLFYLSVPPFAVSHIVASLGEAGLNDSGSVKLLLEKPFGVDLPSAQEAITEMSTHFKESQLYRIDHYLAKEMAQNILAFRRRNALFRHLWNNSAIDSIDILSLEKIGIEGRVQFYEQTGALRDFMQNHMMQLLALTLMDLPTDDSTKDIPERRLKALKSILPVKEDTFYSHVKRGQYSSYKKEVDNPGTSTETLASLTVFSDDPRWQGVPIRLSTGKGLAEQTTEIRISFKKAFQAEANSLTLHIQPKEGIEIDLWAKKPGLSKDCQKVALQFDYKQTPGQPAEAYERVLIDAILSDKSLFTTAEEVIAAWELLQPIQERWSVSDDDLKIYNIGSSIEEALEEG